MSGLPTICSEWVGDLPARAVGEVGLFLLVLAAWEKPARKRTDVPFPNIGIFARISPMRTLLPALLIAGLILCAPRDDRWEIIGPGGGGSQFYPSVSPHDAKRVLVACDMTGSYLTEDGGTRWRMFNLGGTTRFFEWDPNNANVIYAGSNGLYRSADGGKSWNLLFPRLDR
jgi:hypothetical protein